MKFVKERRSYNALATLSRMFVIAICFSLTACTTHTSPRQAPKGEQFLFVTDNEEAIFRAAYDAMSKAQPGYLLSDVDGPVRGYHVNQVWALDSYETVVRVFRAEGEDANGNTVRGYYPEVSGSGTLIVRGPATDKEVYEQALAKFGEVGRKVTVSELRRINYRMDRDRWRLDSKPSLREGGSIKLELPKAISIGKKSVQDRLNELEKLRTSGKISEQEYQKLRQKILSDL